MVHQRQCLALGFEAGDDLFGVHAQLDDLEGHAALDWLSLLSHIDHAAAAFADLLEELVTSDDVPGPLGEGWGNLQSMSEYRRRRFFEERAGGVGIEQDLHALAQGSITPHRPGRDKR